MYNKFITGQFYDGKSLQTTSEVLWRANKHFNLLVRYNHNNVRLPSGSFQINLLSTRIEYAVNPMVFGSVLSQWNSAADEFSMNFRLQVIPKVGTDFYFIVNQIYDTSSGGFNHIRTTVLGKLVWRFML